MNCAQLFINCKVYSLTVGASLPSRQVPWDLAAINSPPDTLGPRRKPGEGSCHIRLTWDSSLGCSPNERGTNWDERGGGD